MIDKDLLKLLGKNKKYVFIVVFLQLLGSLFNILNTALICYNIFLLIEGHPFNDFIYPILGMVGLILARFIIGIVINEVKEKYSREVKEDLRSKTYRKILTLGSNKNMSMAGLTQMSIEGIEQLDLYYSMYLPQFFFSLIAPIVLFIICVTIDWRVSVALLICVPLIPMSIVMVSKYAKKIFNKYWNKYISMGDTFLDNVQGLKELKIFKADQDRHDYINSSAEDFRKITMKVLVMQLASVTIMDLVAFGGAGVGVCLALYGALYQGTSIISALFLILVAVEFFLPLRALGSAFHIAMNGASAGRKLLDLLNMDAPVWGDNNVDNFDININDVSFDYGPRNILKNINLNLEDKKLHAIVGESGCGKSTIVNLIAGDIRPKSGTINVGSNKLETLNRSNYYSHLGIVSYNTYIFNDSIRNNFKLSNNNVSDEEIYESLKKVNLDTFVKENGGLDTIINEDASNISGGQRQRLALAINLVSNKDIYVFDEATSNIDIESEEIIMNNIKELSKEKNVIIISHRLRNIVNADDIYYIEEGNIKEVGNHELLMNNKQGYYKLFNTQKALEDGYMEE